MRSFESSSVIIMPLMIIPIVKIEIVNKLKRKKIVEYEFFHTYLKRIIIIFLISIVRIATAPGAVQIISYIYICIIRAENDVIIILILFVVETFGNISRIVVIFHCDDIIVVFKVVLKIEIDGPHELVFFLIIKLVYLNN